MGTINMKTILIILPLIKYYCEGNARLGRNVNQKDHSAVTESNNFPYVVAILKKTSYLSAGALIDDSWVITDADSLISLKESQRIIRVRIGSSDYKKGGILRPVKFIEIHPFFNDSSPEYDIALIKLGQTVTLTSRLFPVRLQKRSRDIISTHFLVTSWVTARSSLSNVATISPSDKLRRRIMTVSHLHPTDTMQCTEELNSFGINSTEKIMCFDAAEDRDSCVREAGAPVVLNGILWGVISSWTPEDCEEISSPNFAVRVSAVNIASWISATVHGFAWLRVPVSMDFEDSYIRK